MDIHWPIFVKDTDGYMFSSKDADDFAGTVERYDVEDNEYSGWDSDGQPLSIYWHDPASKARKSSRWYCPYSSGSAKVRVALGPPQPDTLREAIIAYARMSNPHEPFESDETDPCTLFLAAEAHALRNTLSARIARFVRKWRARRKSGTAQNK